MGVSRAGMGPGVARAQGGNAVSATGRGGPRVQDDYYGTPAWAVDLILPFVPKGGRYLDAGAGEGQIVSRLLLAGARHEDVTGVELDAKRAAVCLARCPRVRVLEADFLKPLNVAPPDAVIMNPPYDVKERPGTTAFAFVRRAFDLVAPTNGAVFALLRLNWLEGARKGEPERLAFLREHPPDVFILPRRPSFTETGTDSCAYAWLGWTHARKTGRMTWLSEDALASTERMLASRDKLAVAL